MIVVGGAYIERCLEPPRDSLWGSGQRAAILLSLSGIAPEFHTYIGDDSLEDLRSAADIFELKLHANKSPATVTFSYVHCLSVPVITPHKIPNNEPIRITGENVLRFGMMEGDAKVEATMAVYDPQSATNPVLFSANGSSAKRLAIVLNSREAKLIAQADSDEDCAREILSRDRAEVVVIKRGSFGCLVVTEDASKELPAFRTENVFSIGSGDVFCAAFAYFWALHGENSLEAAALSSRAAAIYCDTSALPKLDKTSLLANDLAPAAPSKGRVYLAGPFFNLPQRWLVSEALVHLEDQGHDVKSPLHLIGPGEALDVARKDLDLLVSCDRVFALIDGADPGTLFEVGYARAKGIPVVAFSQSSSDEALKMVVGTDCEVVKDFVTAIYHLAWISTQ